MKIENDVKSITTMTIRTKLDDMLVVVVERHSFNVS